MKNRFRYLSAICVNLLLPWLAYHAAAPHWGHVGGLVASTLPLFAWIVWDLSRHRHFDALSAIVLAGIALSLVTLAIGGSEWSRALEEPMVSGMVGASFLVSLLLPRPMVYYLGRSTLARESPERAAQFETDWKARPDLVASIRLMTLVWGVFMTSENVVRYWLVWTWPGDSRAIQASRLLGYGVYGGLTVWTFLYRRRMKARAAAGTRAGQPESP